MVLRDDLHGEMVLQNLYIRIAAHGFHQAALYLCTGIIGVVENTELRVTALTVQVESAILLLIEVHAPLHQLLDASRRITHHLLHGCRVA